MSWAEYGEQVVAAVAVVRSFTSMRAGIVCAGGLRVGRVVGGVLKTSEQYSLYPVWLKASGASRGGSDWIWRELVKDLFLSFFFFHSLPFLNSGHAQFFLPPPPPDNPNSVSCPPIPGIPETAMSDAIPVGDCQPLQRAV